jgi:hypothetical protein
MGVFSNPIATYRDNVASLEPGRLMFVSWRLTIDWHGVPQLDIVDLLVVSFDTCYGRRAVSSLAH